MYWEKDGQKGEIGKDKIYELLNRREILDFDCGLLCSAACCRPDGCYDEAVINEDYLLENDDEEMGIFLENLGAASYETVRPAYYDITLQGKRLRDSESEKMLDYIYGHIECEYGFMFRGAGIDGTFRSLIADNKETVSTLDAVREAVSAAIAKTMEYYDS